MTHLPPSMCAEMSGAPAWYAVQTAEFMERSTIRHLNAREFGFYFPTRWELDERIKWRRVPLFPEYVFVWISNFGVNLRRILACPGTVRVLGPVPDEMMDVVKWVEFEHIRPGTPRPRSRSRRGWRKKAA